MDLAEIARRSVELVAPTRPNLEASVLGEAQLSVLGDRTSLRQIMDNLVANAFKHTESGAVTVRVEAVGRQQRVVVHYTRSAIFASNRR